MVKGRLISRLGLLVSCMTLLGMGATWVLTSSGATGGTLWVGVLVVAALGFPLRGVVGQKAFEAGPGPRSPRRSVVAGMEGAGENNPRKMN